MNLPVTHKAINRAVERFMACSSIEESRQQFDAMELALFQLPQLQEEAYDLEEYVSGGMYCRKIRIPQGSLITGRMYKFDHLEIMVSGDISILAADGGHHRYQGYAVIEAQAGKRQAGFAHEDTVWMTVNRVPSMPVDEMLDYCTVRDRAEYDEFYRQVDLLDYQWFLNETGLTQEQMDELVTRDDVVDMPFTHIYTADSPLHGLGLFSTRAFKSGDVVCPVRAGEKRTIAGRYANHALSPNTKPVIIDGEYHIQAVRDIPAGTEITMNYRQVLSFRQAEGDKCLGG